MGTDANEKSGRSARMSTTKFFRMGLTLVAALCVWSQANTAISSIGSGLAETAEAALEQGARGLQKATLSEDNHQYKNERDEQAHALEKAQLKALAEKATADADIAKMEAEKLKLEVAKAKMDAERARAEAEKALLNEKAAKENADMHAEMAMKEKQLAQDAIAQTKAMEEAQAQKARDEEEAAKKAALQAKRAAKQAARAEREAAADAAAKAKKEAMLNKEKAAAAEKLKEEVTVMEETAAKEETSAEETEEEKKSAYNLAAKIAAKQAAKTEKETAKAKKEQEKLNEEVAMKEEQREGVTPTEDKLNDEVTATEGTVEEETPAAETEEEKKPGYNLAAKIAAKQAARAEKEAAAKAKKEQVRLNEGAEGVTPSEDKLKDEVAVTEKTAEEETPAAETEEEKKQAYNLAAKIAAKQAARAEKEAAAKAKEEKKESGKEPKPLVVPPGPMDENHDSTIRQWGCGRNETPFIFVHIGKAGGGGVRSRMAAAALQYNRSAWYRIDEDTSYYYPIHDEQGQLHKASFATSKMNNWVPKNFSQIEKDFTFEGAAPCAATTPLGQALSCPMPSKYCGDDIDSSRCDLVYMGHNVLGSELHWLPTQYLVNWWKSTRWGRKKDDFIKYMLNDRFNGGGGDFGEWEVHKKARRIMKYQTPDLVCPPGPLHYRDFLRQYDKCTAPKEPWMDEVTQFETGVDPVIYGAKLISSMPVMRVTVLREPFSWLTSKFFWHAFHVSIGDKKVSPDSGQKKNDLLVNDQLRKNGDPPNFIKCDDMDHAANGWASYRALTYIFYLCGEHCMGGYVKGTMTLDDLERQAAYNLRNSFAVVGLLHKTDDFYDMVSQRVNYMDMSLNPGVKGKQHSSGTHAEALRCKKVYKDPDFKNTLMAKSPAVAALYRLYLIAIEVNEFQQGELAECSAI